MADDRWKRAQSIFEEARERRREDRPAYLGEACEGDAALRAEVESLYRRRVHQILGQTVSMTFGC